MTLPIPDEQFDADEEVQPLLIGFLENFRQASDDRVFQQIMIQAPPELTGSPRVDAMLAAVGEHLALTAGLIVPSWVHEKSRSGPATPSFQPFVATLFRQSAATPLAFKKRNILSGL